MAVQQLPVMARRLWEVTEIPPSRHYSWSCRPIDRILVDRHCPVAGHAGDEHMCEAKGWPIKYRAQPWRAVDIIVRRSREYQSLLRNAVGIVQNGSQEFGQRMGRIRIAFIAGQLVGHVEIEILRMRPGSKTMHEVTRKGL